MLPFFRLSLWLLPCALHTGLLNEQSVALEPLSVKQDEKSISVFEGGQLVTTYHFRSGSKPVFWPIHGADGNHFTRAYPMIADSKDEKHDHPHHRGLWMNFGDVNGHDLWAEGPNKGTICQVATPKVTVETDQVTIRADHVWRGGIPGVNSVSEELQHGCDQRSEELAHCQAVYVIAVEGQNRSIDCFYALTATQDLQFGDTKEGMFAIRVPEPMKVDNKVGRILTSENRTGADSWGYPAKWIDYSGPTVPSKSPDTKSPDTYGIAILVHPESFQAAGRWHVRSYGLFAHNAFGAKDFPAIESKDQSSSPELQNPPVAGGYKLGKGDSIRFGYRVIFHKGAFDLEQGNRAFREFAKTKLPLE